MLVELSETQVRRTRAIIDAYVILRDPFMCARACLEAASAIDVLNKALKADIGTTHGSNEEVEK